MAPAAKATPAAKTARIILLVSALLLPTLSLVPLGGMYLWEKGWLLPWAIAAFVVSAAVYLSQRWLLTPASPAQPAATATADAAAPPGWSPAEAAAWKEVGRIAAAVDVDKLDSVDAVLALGQRTLDAVSRKLHPEKPDALWQFTLPEALAIVERVSRRLGRFTVTSIPFGDRLTVAQVLRAYSWRGFIDVAERAYDVWRILRIANPATAVTHEARERLSKAVLAWGREHVSRRFAEAYVEEVGRAAIDLYGGRLRVAHGYDTTSPAGLATSTTSRVALLIAGGDEATREHLAAVVHEAQAEHARAMMRAMSDRDSHGTTATAAMGDVVAVDVRLSDADLKRGRGTADLVAEARACDVVAWVLPRGGAVPESDFAAATAIAEAFRAAPHQLAPVLLPIVVSGGDASVVAAADDDIAALAVSFGAPGVKPIRLDLEEKTSNAVRIAMWAALERTMPAALRVRAVRRVEELKGARPGLLGTGLQAASAIGQAARSIFWRTRG